MRVIALFLALTVSAHGQMLQSITNAAALAGLPVGTFTAIQVGNCAVASGASTCSATVTSAFTTNKVHYYTCAVPNTAAGTISVNTHILSINTGETLTPLVGSSVGQYGNTGTVQQLSTDIVLPGAAAAHASPIVITLNQATTGGGGYCYIAELTPSANAANIGVDNDNMAVPAAACTSCTAPNLALSGTGDAICQWFQGGTAYTNPSAVSSPYTTNAYLPGSGNGVGFSCAATPANGNGPTWTAASVIPILGATSIGWNVSPYLSEGFLGFEGGTAGNQPAAADLVSSMKGWAGCRWAINSTTSFVYATAASMPLVNTVSRLSDGSGVTAGSGTMGIQVTGTGAAQNNSATCSWINNNSQPNMALSFKYNENFVATDSSLYDSSNIHGITDFAGTNNYGDATTRYLRLETAEGNGSNINWNPLTQCPCTTVIQYNAGGGGITASSVSASVTGAVATFTGTFTASQWPVGFAFTPSAGTGGTNYNGNLFYVTSSNATTVTASSTGLVNGGGTAVASGSETGLTLTGQHAVLGYDHTGAFIGASFHAGSTSADYPGSFVVGDNSSRVLASGKTAFMDSFVLSLTPKVPAQ